MIANAIPVTMRCALVLVGVVVAGCGPGISKVTGRVLLDNAPVPGGRITFRPADPAANSVSVEINEQGQYQAMLPVGEVMVSIDNRELQPRPARGPIALPGMAPDVQSKLATEITRPIVVPNERSGRYVPIASRYYTAETSQLTFTVIKGDMVKDLELTK